MRMASNSVFVWFFFWVGGGCQIQTLDSTDGNAIRLWRILDCYKHGKNYNIFETKQNPSIILPLAM